MKDLAPQRCAKFRIVPKIRAGVASFTALTRCRGYRNEYVNVPEMCEENHASFDILSFYPQKIKIHTESYNIKKSAAIPLPRRYKNCCEGPPTNLTVKELLQSKL